MRDLHLDRLVALLHEVQRLLDHAVAAGAAETARAVDRDLRAIMAPQPVQRQAGALAHRIPQRDVDRRHRHRGDAAAAIGHRRRPQIAPDRLDRGGVLALHARDDALVETGRDRLHAGAEHEQITHAGDATGGFDLANENVARRAQRMALEPGVVGPGQAQHRHAHVANRHIGAGGSHRAFPLSWPGSCSPDLGQGKSTTDGRR